MYNLLFSKEQLERLTDSLIRLASYYQQHALQCEATHKPEGAAASAMLRRKEKGTTLDYMSLQIVLGMNPEEAEINVETILKSIPVIQD